MKLLLRIEKVNVINVFITIFILLQFFPKDGDCDDIANLMDSADVVPGKLFY